MLHVFVFTLELFETKRQKWTSLGLDKKNDKFMKVKTVTWQHSICELRGKSDAGSKYFPQGLTASSLSCSQMSLIQLKTKSLS